MFQLVKMYELPGSDQILAELIQTIDDILGSLTGIYYFAHLYVERTCRLRGVLIEGYCFCQFQTRIFLTFYFI